MSASQEILRLDLLNREAFLLQKIGVSWESHGSLMGVLWESHGSLTLPICHHFHAQEEAWEGKYKRKSEEVPPPPPLQCWLGCGKDHPPRPSDLAQHCSGGGGGTCVFIFPPRLPFKELSNMFNM